LIQLRLDTPKRECFIRVVCISDIHDQITKIIHRIPDGDILICAGDFTHTGSEEKLKEFDETVGKLPHKFKIVIAGNHDLGFQDDYSLSESQENIACRGLKGTPKGYKLLKNCIYLQDSSTKVMGLNIYGSSWHPLPGFPFYLPRGQQLLEKWNLIPTGTDILVTHTPPLGHNDIFNKENTRCGCSELLNTVEKRVHPKFHVFGHIHEQNGVTTNGETTFINASICTHALNPIYDPVIFDIPKP
uniref:Metallophos domain-containing protein n=1 Tax=Enterobius vermicularis TaxID=51028 RepID=A0A0N4UZT6_ENTVE